PYQFLPRGRAIQRCEPVHQRSLRALRIITGTEVAEELAQNPPLKLRDLGRAAFARARHLKQFAQMMLDRNNMQIADLLINWIAERPKPQQQDERGQSDLLGRRTRSAHPDRTLHQLGGIFAARTYSPHSGMAA